MLHFFLTKAWLSSLALHSGFINTISLQGHNSCPEGASIFQPVETAKKVNVFICPNAFCGKTFAQPLIASNLRGSAVSFNACPYCLTVIPSDQETVLLDDTSKEGAEQSNMLSNGAASKLEECKYHFGYLSERSGKGIPDECLMCKAIVQCMLKTKESVGK